MKNGLFKRIYKKAFAFIIILLGFGVAFGFASLNFQKINADTSYYEDISEYVVNDWQNYQNYTSGNLELINNGDGTFTCQGSTTTIKEFVLPITITSASNTQYFSYALALAVNNTLPQDNTYSYVKLYVAYNNGDNLFTTYVNGGSLSSGTNIRFNKTGLCLVLQFSTTTNIESPIIITPFFYLREYPYGTNPPGNVNMNIYTINKTLGPQGAPDLTKVNYIQEASNISLPISTQTSKAFGNELENLIQYTMQAGDTITVDTAGVASTTIDLLTMTAGNDIYKMTFINDALSNDYLNIFLYKNNDATLFYNDNLGELSAQNITNFRTWASMAINANATITSASANNNNILNKIFVYSTGTNYETGYTAGYNDARQDVEVELQEAWADGLEQGYQDGYTTGYGEGYDQGAIEGVDTSWLINLFGTIDTFFSIHLFPNLTIGTLFAIPFVLSIAWVIIRILRGGGYGD